MNHPSKAIQLRQATPDDAAAIATCLLPAMEEIVYGFIGERNHAEALAFLHYFAAIDNNQYSWQNCTLAIENSSVAGAINIYEGAKLAELRTPVLQRIHQHYHQALQPEDETGPGEWYIDTLGVLPAYRGKGIGRQLVQAAIDHYVFQQGHTLGLLVDPDNTTAKKLYAGLGFRQVGVKPLLGKLQEHWQRENGIM